jgi:sterol desaturase/sphingolipid hydroxylase (fatty acid hydroxylase superfamily)
MNAQQYGTSVGLVLAVMAAVALLETVIPLFARPATAPGRRRVNLGMTAQALLVAFGMSSAVGVAALYLPSPDLMATLALPAVAQFVVGIVAADFAYGYAAHRALHASPTLWRYHRVHHSDPFVDVTTSYRTHLIEIAWRYLWLFAAVWMLGIPAAAVAVFRLLSALNGLLEHANIRVRPTLDAAVSRLWVTPNMHKVHHSRLPAETNSNYGNLFALHDRLLGTFVPTARALSVRYGLHDIAPAEIGSFGALLALPWRSRPDGAAPLQAPEASR